MNKQAFLGIDVGSVTTKFAALDTDERLLFDLYIPTGGQPVRAVQEGLSQLGSGLGGQTDILAVAATGSARLLAGAIAGADIIKNEITCQAVAAIKAVPGVQTVIEIGGQDSKLICIRDGLVTDFGMNTVCAAGTGSFLNHQAGRLQMSIEEFSRRAEHGVNPARIAGRCTVFAETDMIHKQQTGSNVDDIIYGLCRALAQNLLNDLGSGKEILPPVVFQGGVAFNGGIVRALNDELGTGVIVPPHHEVMGAIGAAMLAREHYATHPGRTSFRGFDKAGAEIRTELLLCDECETPCEVTRVLEGDETIGAWGGRCDKWHIKLVGQGVK